MPSNSECNPLFCCNTPQNLHRYPAHFPIEIVSHLPGGHLPPPNSDISHPPKKNICQEDNCHPQLFFFFFWRIFLGLLDLQLMEDIKDGKEEVLNEVVMEHIK